MRRQTYLFAVLSIVIVAFSQAFANPIPFSLKRGVPEIEVIINDSIKASLIIDTGADHVYIDKSFAEKHGLLSGGKMPMRPTTGINEKVESFQIFLRSMTVGESKQNVVSAVTIDLKAIVKDTSQGMPDGVLGYSFLKNHKLLFDYNELTLELIPEYFHSPDWKTAVMSIVMDRHLITVNTTVNDSIDCKMILDTGASYTIFSPALAGLTGLKDSVSVAKIRLDKRITIDGVSVVVKDISYISNLLKDTRISGILGSSYLSGHKFVLDYKNNQLIYIAN